MRNIVFLTSHKYNARLNARPKVLCFSVSGANFAQGLKYYNVANFAQGLKYYNVANFALTSDRPKGASVN